MTRGTLVAGLTTLVLFAVPGAAPAGQPSNDDVPDARVLAPSQFESEADLMTFGASDYATIEPNEPRTLPGADEPSVWFAWEAKSSRTTVIDTCDSKYDTILRVGTGAAADGLAVVASNDDAPAGACASSRASQVTFTPAAGTTYRIGIAGNQGADGDYRLRLRVPPANDTFATATALRDGLDRSVEGDLRGSLDQEVWYRWRATTSGVVTVDTCAGAATPTVLTSAGGTVAARAVQPACDDSFTSETRASFAFDAVAGATYRIRVTPSATNVSGFPFPDAPGPFTLRLRGRPANDDFATPTVIAPAGGLPELDTSAATAQSTGPADGLPDVWTSWTPTADRIAYVGACREGGRPTAYIGTSLTALTPVGTEVSCRNGGRAVRLLTTASSSTALRVRHTADGSTGPRPVDFIAGLPAVNDLPSNAIALSGAEPRPFTDTRMATVSDDEPGATGDDRLAGATVWYRWRVPFDGVVRIDGCDTDGVRLFRGPLPTLVEQTPLENAYCVRRYAVSEGQRPYLRVGGMPSDPAHLSAGTVRFDMEEPPANDRVQTAETIAGDAERVDGDTRYARPSSYPEATPDGQEVSRPTKAAVFYRWSPPEAGTYTFATCSEADDPSLGAQVLRSVDGNFSEAFAAVPTAIRDCDGGQTTTFTAAPGERYLVIVRVPFDDGRGSPFSLRIARTPDNDDERRAVALPGRGVVDVAGTTVGATPLMGVGDPQQDVVYRWVAPASGAVVLDACTSTGDTTVRVDGDGVRTTTDDGCATGDGARTRFTARAGKAYLISVGAPKGRVGSFTLMLRQHKPSDFNADGYADVAVGVPGRPINGAAEAGLVRVISGSAYGLRTGVTPQTLRQPGAEPETGDHFGAVTATGDFNGDAYADLAVGAPNDSRTKADEGVVSVFYGSAGGLVAGPVIDQAALGTAAFAGDHFGAVLAAADLDGDLADELVIGSPDERMFDQDATGTVRVLDGVPGTGIVLTGAETLHQSVTGIADAPEAGDRFGAAVAVGRFDRDEALDLAVGVPGEDQGTAADAGLVHVLYGDPGGFAAQTARSAVVAGDTASGQDGIEQNDRLGSALAAGNFNGDREDDLAVGSPGETNGLGENGAGAVSVLYGQAAGLHPQDSLTVTHPDLGATNGVGDNLGAALATGDLGNDREADLVFGAPSRTTAALAPDAGAAWVVFGNPESGLTIANRKALTSPFAGGGFGSVLHLADVRGNTRLELLAGRPTQDSGSTVDPGGLTTFLGAPAGPSTETAYTPQQFGQAAAGDRFGAALG